MGILTELVAYLISWKKYRDINEWVVHVSNKTFVSKEQTKRIPETTVLDARAFRWVKVNTLAFPWPYCIWPFHLHPNLYNHDHQNLYHHMPQTSLLMVLKLRLNWSRCSRSWQLPLRALLNLMTCLAIIKTRSCPFISLCTSMTSSTVLTWRTIPRWNKRAMRYNLN